MEKTKSYIHPRIFCFVLFLFFFNFAVNSFHIFWVGLITLFLKIFMQTVDNLKMKRSHLRKKCVSEKV